MFFRRAFSSTTATFGHRALIYSSRGEPASVIRAVTFPNIPPPPPKALNVRVLAAPVNPSDVNTVQGVYPSKPLPASEHVQAAAGGDEPVFVGGNEGIAEVVEVGTGVEGVSKGDWVLITKPQPGTWSSRLTIGADEVIRVNKHERLSAAHASTLTVNPPTAWNLLHDFVKLSPGDFVLQNGANSAVGQNVIQFARHLGFKTINFVRNRENFQPLKEKLQHLGADYVFTYDELTDKSFSSQINEITGDKPIQLFLNCVAGRDTTAMAKLVGHDAHLVTYGGMSKQPLSVPVSLHIFRNLTSHGFMQNSWYRAHSREERKELVEKLTTLISEGKLHPADSEVITLEGHKTDAQITEEVRSLMQKMADGFGKKIILKIEDTVDIIEGSP